MGCEDVWVDDFKSLFCDWRLIPRAEMTLGQKTNAATRLILVSTIIIAIFSSTFAIIFFIISMFLLISCYFMFKNLEIYMTKNSEKEEIVEFFVCSKPKEELRKKELLGQIHDFLKPMRKPVGIVKNVKKVFKYNIVPAV